MERPAAATTRRRTSDFLHRAKAFAAGLALSGAEPKLPVTKASDVAFVLALPCGDVAAVDELGMRADELALGLSSGAPCMCFVAYVIHVAWGPGLQHAAVSRLADGTRRASGSPVQLTDSVWSAFGPTG